MPSLARTSIVVLTSLTLLLGSAACSNTETSSDGGSGASEGSASGVGSGGRELAESVTVDPAVRALVPEDITAKGTLRIVTDPTYAPIDFTDSSGAIVGLEPDLATAVANKMGLKVEFNKGDFNGILAGIEAKRYDASWAAFSVTAERQTRVNMVSYMKGGTSVMVKSGNPAKIGAVTDLCGKTVAAQTGTTQALTVLPSFQKECANAGKGAITPLILPQQDNVNQAVSTGRAAAMAADKALIAYYAQLDPDLFSQVNDILVAPSLAGVVVNKADTKLATAFEKALNALIKDGTYGKILKAWGLDATAVDAAAVNPAK